MTPSEARTRSVARVVNSVETQEGEGIGVRRCFPIPGLPEIDPFLLLDELGPVDLGPGAPKGVPAHPHRGFETVTYLLAGRMDHRDSRGHQGTIGPGDVQWMTAGSGVVHSEMPEREFARAGGRLHGFQLWVNLPGRDKMIPPRYQEVPAARIPVVRTPDGRAKIRLIAGEALGARAVVETRTPIVVLRFEVDPGGAVSQPLPPGHNGLAYVIDGAGTFDAAGTPAEDGQLVLFAQDGDAVAITNPSTDTPLDFLYLAGVPIGEPVVRHGPFVMNSREEILQAIEDFHSGRMGQIGGG